MRRTDAAEMRELLLNRSAGKQPPLSVREFESLLIKPVQRVLRYPLLLEHMCRLLPDARPAGDGFLHTHLQRTNTTVPLENSSLPNPLHSDLCSNDCH